MKNTLLTVIAVCLVLITFKLYVPDAQAEEPRSRGYITRVIERCEAEVRFREGSRYLYGGINC